MGRASYRTTVCAYCDAVLTDVVTLPFGALAEPWEGRPEDAGKPRLLVGGRRYVVRGRLARGDSSDVFLGHLDARLTERVVLKVLRAPEDEDLLRREQRVLRRLEQSAAPGSAFFRTLLPQRVAHGPGRLDGREAPLTSVLRWRSGFSATLDDVVAAYPRGVDPRAAIWIWKRALELLGWVHRSGVVHGAVLPPHMLLHPRDHGLVLVGWSAAVGRHGRRREPLPALRASARELYPEDVWEGAPAGPETDLTMCARAITRVLGADPASGRTSRTGRRVPAPIAALLRRYADPGANHRTDDAWALKEEVSAAAHEAFGPPTYHRLQLGRRRR